MARIRSVKPEFWSDRRLATRVSRDARLLYVALWNFADEHGRLQGDARYVKGNCLPYDDDLDLPDVERLLDDLERAGRIQRYDHDGDPYIYLPKLAGHQRLEPAKVPSRLPEPPEMSAMQPYPDPDADGDADESAPRPNEVARHPDKDARHPDKDALLYVAGGREQVASGRDVALRADPPDDPTGKLLAEHANAYAQPPPPSALMPVKQEIMRLVAERVPPDRIRAGLARLREKRLAASLLPQLVTETAPVARPSTTDQAVAAGRALSRRYAEAGE